MSECRIVIDNVHLCYPSAVFNSRTLKQTVFELLRLQKPKPLLMDVHALRGVSLEIRSGERVGVIGSNGAGKSTLLKAISGIYPVTSGSITVEGSIRSLFDLSTGFEMDATGRENILYRGLLLGETPESIEARMGEIIAFSELGDFIDYPIKSYSSGMLIRLAFSISTMISGDILLLDEVFGAGDAAFVQKAQRRIIELVDSASILVFVSHDLDTILKMCNRVVWIKNGLVHMDGQPDEIVSAYREAMSAAQSAPAGASLESTPE